MLRTIIGNGKTHKGVANHEMCQYDLVRPSLRDFGRISTNDDFRRTTIVWANDDWQGAIVAESVQDVVNINGVCALD